MDYKIEKFEEFNVINNNEKYIFFHFNFNNDNIFYSNLFNYFFNEKKLLTYFKNKKNIEYEPTQKNYCLFYKKLKIFIDDFNIHKITDYPSIIYNIINDEYEILVGCDEKNVRVDKIGKIGEYMLNHILIDYFDSECILPKLMLTTDYNMPVFGIDTIHYSTKENIIFFGESKITKKIYNGVSLINQTLKGYEKQIKDEFSLILSSELTSLMGEDYKKNLLDYANTTINFEDFIRKANINKIGIPLFIAHGTENNSEQIIKELEKIKQSSFLGIQAKYILISLPIIDKDKFKKIFTKEIEKKVLEYEKYATE